MKIRKLRLKNGYKRFHDLTIDLGDSPARIVALVGPNGCGKSSVLDGMLFHHTAHNDLGSGPRRDYKYHSMSGKPDYGYSNVEIEFDAGPYLTVRGQLGDAKVPTLFSFRSPYRYNSELKITQVQSTSELRLNDYGARDASALDQKMEVNYRRLHGMMTRFMYENNARPSDAADKVIGDLNASLRDCLDLEIANVGIIEEAKGTLYFKKPDQPTDFEFNVLSSGEIQRAFLRRKGSR